MDMNVQAPTDGAQLIAALKTIVGRRYVITDPAGTRRFRTGYRSGTGGALAVARPGTLIEMWRTLRVCAAADRIVIVQAANTGLTGGSTPDGDDYDREIVIVNTLRLAKFYLLDEGRQVLCLPGTTLFQLEAALKPLGRDPHSLIGSSCVGASVFGGICNNSGGALIHRGPAYTQMALYAQIDPTGHIRLVNHLGIRLGNDPETILARVEHGDFGPDDIQHDPAVHASDHDYAQYVRDVTAETPARFNADPKRLFEASGSAGKVMLLAVRLDTFPSQKRTATFYIGTNDPSELTEVRRHMLTTFKELPVSGEYIHRVAFDIAEKYGKDMVLAIRHFGTNRLPTMFALKGRFDAFMDRLKFAPHDLSDRVMQAVGSLFPRHLSKRLYEYRNRFEHHLILQMGGVDSIEEARGYLSATFPSAHGDYFECSAEEAESASSNRFVAAGAAVRYRAIHRRDVEDIVALDVALPRNTTEWFEHLPHDVAAPIIHRLYYGHFFCQVFHQDYIVAKGHDTTAIENSMWTLLDARGAEYPAEHNVGHLYNAKEALAGHYRTLDPSNAFNPGIGRTSKQAHWR